MEQNHLTVNRTLRELLMQLCIAALYLLFGLLVHHYIISSGIVSVLWPGSGLALAVLLVGGRRYIWGVLLGSLLLNALSNNALWAVFGITLANVLEALTGLWLLTRYVPTDYTLRTLNDYLRLIALGGGVSSVVGALLGVLSLLLGGVVPSGAFFENFTHWWMGDVLGIALLVPLITGWWIKNPEKYSHWQRLERVSLILMSLIAGQVVFLGWFHEYLSDTPKGYFMFLFVSWVAIRLGVRSVTLVVLMIAVQALTGAILRVGYFEHDIDRAALHNYWAYMLILSVIGMAMTTYVNELRQGLKALKLKDSALNAAANGIVITNIQGGIEWANRAFCRLTGYSISDVYGHNPRELVKSGKHDPAFYRQLWETILSNNIWRGEIVNRRKDGTYYDEDMTITPLSDEQGSITHFVAVKQDITERKRAEGQEQFRSNILGMLAEGKSINAILKAIVCGVEQLNPLMLCSILWLDIDGLHLGNAVAPSLPDFYNAAIDGIEIGLGVGSCGTAAFTGQRVIVEDIATHPYWAPYRELAASAGLGSCWSQPVWSASGQVLGTFAIYHHEAHLPLAADISLIEQSANLVSIAIDRRQAEEKLRVSDQALKAISQGVLITDVDSRILSVNDAFLSISGYEKSEILGQTCRFLQGPLTDQAVIAAIRLAVEQLTEFTGVILNYRKDGSTFWNELTISPVFNDCGQLTHFIGITRDITERRLMEEQVQHLAFYDTLTNLPNRRLLNERLSQIITVSRRNNQYAALMVLDLDNFKPLNDTHGHVVGDLLLIEAAKRLKDCIREADTVARFGGDEFVVILSELGVDQAESVGLARMVADKICVTLAEPYALTVTHENRAESLVEHRCTASIGVFVFSGHRNSQEEILACADAAMYQAKALGNNQVRFYQEE